MKIKKLGNLKFRTKTKVYIPITVVLITVILLSSAIPVADIKLGTDGSGVNWFGPIDAITNSNNHYWAATGANFKLAYYDLNATGGTVYLPPGHFQFAISGLKLHNNSNIQGSGIGVTFVEATTGYASGAALLHNYAEPDVNNVTISDLTVFGNSSAGGFNRGCIRIDGGKDITITNVYCYNPLDRGALSITNADRVVVSDVFAYNVSGAQQGVSCDTISNAVFNNLVIWNGTGAGLDISTSHHVTVTNVVIKDTLGCKFPASENISVSNIEINNGGMNIWNTNYSSFSNVAVYNSANNGINIDEYCDYIVLNNIRINNAGTNGIVLEGRHLQINNGVIKNSSTRALSITTDAHNVTISNVDFDTFNQYNLIDLTENIKITGCSFLNGVDSDSYGLALKNCDVVKILGCSISYGASYGIVLYNTLCENVTITDCDILNNGNDGIWIGAQAHKNCLITDNTIRGNTNEQIDDDGTGDNVIINNNPGYETVIPTANVTTAQIGFAYISGSGLLVKGSDGWFNLTESGSSGVGDPWFNASDAFHVTSVLMDNWNTSFGWGNDFNYSGYNQDLNTTDAPTFVTLDTGQGANDLYDMNQNVLTSSLVEFENVTVDDTMIMNNGGVTWNIYVNATGVLVFETE